MPIDEEKLSQFVERAFADLSAGYGGVMVAVGDKLGLYKAMAGNGPLTSQELAARTGCAERYVREWLNAQAAGHYVLYHPESGSYELTPEQAFVLADDMSPCFIPPAWNVPISMFFDVEKTIEAFRTGKGVSWGEHDERLFCGSAVFFRNSYRANLLSSWLPALDGVTDRLAAGAKIADIGCGHGHSAILMAEAFPNSRFWGFDGHPGSIEEARRNAERAGVADRVSFEVSKADDYRPVGYDLICFFDSLHDMGRPVAAARHAASALADNGTVMLIEPYAGDRVEDNLTPVGRLYYAASTAICTAHAISESGTHALGAQAGEARLAEIFAEAGFGHFRRATETPFNLIIEARRRAAA